MDEETDNELLVKRSNEIYSKLMTMQREIENETYKAWLGQVIEYIKDMK